ncbi:hypothetical protein ACFX11_038078 [Malus domestica]
MTLYYEVVIYERRNYLCVPNGHCAAWGEDLVLADRSGEIFRSYGLRDTEQALGRELVISGYGRRDHDAAIGPGVYIYSVILLAAHHAYETICEMIDILISAMFFRDMTFEMFLAC